MPLRSDDFFDGEFDGLGGVGWIGEDIGIANENGHYEERASQVADEGESPVLKHLEDTGTTVKGRYRCELIRES